MNTCRKVLHFCSSCGIKPIQALRSLGAEKEKWNRETLMGELCRLCLTLGLKRKKAELGATLMGELCQLRLTSRLERKKVESASLIGGVCPTSPVPLFRSLIPQLHRWFPTFRKQKSSLEVGACFFTTPHLRRLAYPIMRKPVCSSSGAADEGNIESLGRGDLSGFGARPRAGIRDAGVAHPPQRESGSHLDYYPARIRAVEANMRLRTGSCPIAACELKA
jgi:hypothetical protein